VPATRREYDLSAAGPGADQQLLEGASATGTWYVLVYGESVPSASPFTLTVSGAPVFLTGLTPDRYGTNQIATLTLSGSGFLPGTQVGLVATDGTVRAAQSVGVDAFSQVSATFDLTGVAEGEYDVRVILPGGASNTLRSAFHVEPAGEAKLETNLILPSPLGKHMPATIYVEFANTGTAAMPAPILILQSPNALPLLTLDRSGFNQGFWTWGIPEGFSNSVQIYASGAVPGLLQPGEDIRVPVYYGGLQLASYNVNPVKFEILIHDAGDTSSVPWDTLKTDLQPSWIPGAAWAPIFANLTAQIGPTWGDYVQMLSDNATYLGRLGRHVLDVNQLYGFELQQALGLNPISTLAASADASLTTPGLSLDFSRSFGNTILERYQDGPLGFGWTTPWTSTTIEEVVDPVNTGRGTLPIKGQVQQVTIREPGGLVRVFSPDSRYPDDRFLGQPGDTGKLRLVSWTPIDDPFGSDVFYRQNVYELTEANGMVTRFQGGVYLYKVHSYDFLGRQTPVGHEESLQDVNGNRITFGYTNGRLTSLMHSSDATLSFTYNPAGRFASVTDSAGRMTTYTYDASGQHLLSATGPAGTTTYTYSVGAGAAREHALTSVTDPSGVTRFFDYDDRGRLIATYLTGNAEHVEFTYDEAGKVTMTDATGAASSVFFDHRGLVARTEDALGSYTRYEYGDDFLVSRVTDSLGHSVSYTWCNCGSLKSVTDQLGRTTTFTLGGPLNHPTAFTDANGNTTRYTYDAAGDLTSTTYADGSIERIAYDAVGDPTSLINRRGQAIGMTYNAAGQVTRETFPDRSTINYTYDARGRLSTVVDTQGTTTFTYDTADRLTEEVAL
jgi:YD repeat-containing protein